MIDFLIKKCIRDWKNTDDRTVRERYGVLAGVLGIICNAFLFVLKLVIGIIMNSISVMSDAFHNLSDMGSSFVAIFGVKLSNKKPDRDHPFGHGRMEYISAFIVSGIIIVVGIELLKSSVEKIFNPSPVNFAIVPVVILTLSLLVKLWMYFYNKKIGNLIKSSVIIATASDSLNDCISTLAVIIAAVVGHFTGLNLDGYMGALVALLILWAGISVAKDVIGDLLGGPPEPELVQSLEKIVLENGTIVGVHDLIVHNYGPGRIFASVHAEIPDSADVVAAHEIIDYAEKRALEETGVILVIHMDPICVSSPLVTETKCKALEVLKEINPSYTMHDFRITEGEKNINLIFDVVVPAGMTDKEKQELVSDISGKMRLADRRLSCVIQVDTDYTVR